MARGQRELVALAAIPLLAAIIIFLPPWAFLAVIAVAAALACDELMGMARGIGLAAGRWLPIALVVVLLAAAWIYGARGLGAGAIVVVIVLPTVRLGDPRSPSGALGGAAAEVFAVLYLGATAACLGWLLLWPEHPQGIKLLAFYLLCIWVGDSGAYYVGSHVGRHRMTPRISPNKTWEGLAGGAVATCAATAV